MFHAVLIVTCCVLCYNLYDHITSVICILPLELQQSPSVAHCPLLTARQVGAWFLQGFTDALASIEQILLPADFGGRHPKLLEQHRSSPKQRYVAEGEYELELPCPSDGPHKEHC